MLEAHPEGGDPAPGSSPCPTRTTSNGWPCWAASLSCSPVPGSAFAAEPWQRHGS